MTISEELNKIINSKEAIRQSIINKGTDVGTDVPLSQYASKIDEIQTVPVEYENPDFYEIRTNGGINYDGLFARMSGDSLDLRKLDTSKVTSFQYLFDNCSVKNIDVSTWNTKNVTNLYYMFNQFNGGIDISNWEFPNVKSTNYVFTYANLSNIKGLENKNPFPNATGLGSYFYNATKKGETIDLSKWNIDNVTNLYATFSGVACKRLDLTNWKTTNVKDMSNIFSLSYSDAIEELIIPDWDMTNVTSYSSMFGYSASYIKNLRYIDLSRSNDITISKMASALYAKTQDNYGDVAIPTDSSQEVIDALIAKYWRPVGPKLDLTSCEIVAELDEVLLGKTTKVHMGNFNPWYGDRENNLEYVTSDGSVLTIDQNGIVTTHSLGSAEVYVRSKDSQEVISNILTINVAENYTNLNEFKFRTNDNTAPKNYSINGVTLSSSNCTFDGISKIWTHNPTGNIILMKSTANDYSTCNISEIIKTNTENITNMEKMFYNCNDLTTLDVSKWNVSNVTDMTRMFYGCKGLTTLDVSNWNVSNVDKMIGLFNNCDNLTVLDLSNWVISDVANVDLIFFKCDSLTELNCNVAKTINKIASQLLNPNGTIYTTCDPSELNMETIQSKGWTVEFISEEVDYGNAIVFSTLGSKYLSVNGEDVTDQVVELPSEIALFSTEQPVVCVYYLPEDAEIYEATFSGNQDLYEVIQLDTSKITNTTNMFYDCISLSTIPDLDLSSVEYMDYMFYNCCNMEGYIDPDKYWNNSKVVSHSYCFLYCNKLNNYSDLPEGWITQDPVPLERLILANNEGYYIFDSSITFESGVDSYQFNIGFEPWNTTQTNVRWMSDNENVAIVEEWSGLVTRVGYGDVNIACVSTDNPNIKVIILLTFISPEGNEPSDPEGNEPSISREVIFTTTGAKTLTVNNVNVTDNVEEVSTDENGLITCRYVANDDITQISFNYCNEYGGYMTNDVVEVVQLDTSNVTDMSNMFKFCRNLETIPQLDTSKVTNMRYMFDNCNQKLKTIPQLDTSKVTNMSGMFNYCWTLETIPQLDTSKVTNMSGMFNQAGTMANSFSIPQLDTSNVTDMSQMFRQSNIIDIPDLNTGSVTNIELMFFCCNKLTGYANSEKYWQNGNITTFNNCFYDCTNLDNYNDIPYEWGGPEEPGVEEPGVEESSENVIRFTTRGSKKIIVNNTDVTDQVVEESTDENGLITCSYTSPNTIEQVKFADNGDLVELLELDSSNITKMNGMFDWCTSLEAIPQLDTSKVTNMNCMFNWCTSLKSIPQLDTSNVEDMGFMFNSCSLLEVMPDLDTTKVIRMGMMFRVCTAMTGTVDPDKYWNKGNVIEFDNCFTDCTGLSNYDDIPDSWKGL